MFPQKEIQYNLAKISRSFLCFRLQVFTSLSFSLTFTFYKSDSETGLQRASLTSHVFKSFFHFVYISKTVCRKQHDTFSLQSHKANVPVGSTEN